MVSPTSGPPPSAHSLGELAEVLGGRVAGDAAQLITAITTLEEAGPHELAFFTDARYQEAARASRAGALLVPEKGDLAERVSGRNLLVCADVALARVRLLVIFHPPAPHVAGVHATAVVDPAARVSPEAAIGPYAVIGAGCEVRANASIGAHVVLGRGVFVGEGAILHPHAVVYDGCRIGARAIVHAGVVIGADGFGYVSRADGHHKVPQVGIVELGEDVEVGANSAIDRATLGATRVGAGTKIDNLVQVGHNVQIGRACLLCGQSGVAGSSRLGEGVVLAGQAGVADHVEIGDRVQVGAASAVLRSVETGVVGGIPAVAYTAWRRQAVLLGRLEELFKRMLRLERRVDPGGGQRQGEDESGE